MSRLRREYFLSLRVVGFLSLPISTYLLYLEGIPLANWLFFALALPAAWLRVRFEPSTYLTLAPLVSFLGLLAAGPYTSLMVISLAALASSRFFSRNSWTQSLEELGEEVVPAVVMVLVFVKSSTVGIGRFGEIGAFTSAVAAYIVVRMAVAVLRANLIDGIGKALFLFGPGKYIFVNLAFFALAALGLDYLASSYLSARYLLLALATVTLIEFYHPWKLLTEQSNALFSSLAMIAQAIDTKDPYTARHSRNVARVAAKIARAMLLPEREVAEIQMGALLHDIGKIGVSGTIIRKPSGLTSEEASVMRRHSVMSADIMQPIELLAGAAEIVRHHHEHYDGSGYPDGMKDAEIPLGSRIILVADAFDAMITDRPYRRGRSKGEALKVLKEHAGRQFDPKVVATFESIIDLL